MPDEPAVRGYVVGPGEGVPDRTPDVKASGRSTGGSLTVMELAVDGGPPRHTHTREDESLYVFTGSWTWGAVRTGSRLDQGRLCSCPATCRTPSGPLVAR
jgi:hypothetical protein